MKLNKIELLLGSLLSMIGCSDGKTMPEGQLVSLQYSTNVRALKRSVLNDNKQKREVNC